MLVEVAATPYLHSHSLYSGGGPSLFHEIVRVAEDEWRGRRGFSGRFEYVAGEEDLIKPSCVMTIHAEYGNLHKPATLNRIIGEFLISWPGQHKDPLRSTSVNIPWIHFSSPILLQYTDGTSTP